jgi:hypothetical protein
VDEAIEDETPHHQYDEDDGKKYIEDFYDNDSEDNEHKSNNENQEDLLDMDYSRTQLDDFLKS